MESDYVKIAELEKVILDYFYFKSDTYSIDLLLEKLRKAKDRIDLEKLFRYARKFPEATKRKLGFVLDLLKINTRQLRKAVGTKGYRKVSANSSKFNAKGRVYYEKRFSGEGGS